MRLIQRIGTVAGCFTLLLVGGAAAASADYQSAPILKYGSRHPNVGCVQHALDVIGRYYSGTMPYKLTTDSIFGDRTKADVVAYQRWTPMTSERLAVDGIVGPKTRASLDKMIDMTFRDHYKTRDPELFRVYYGNCIYDGGNY
jgi:hypothetical protein